MEELKCSRAGVERRASTRHDGGKTKIPDSSWGGRGRLYGECTEMGLRRTREGWDADVSNGGVVYQRVLHTRGGWRGCELTK
jgi:hypothetical protein